MLIAIIVGYVCASLGFMAGLLTAALFREANPKGGS